MIVIDRRPAAERLLAALDADPDGPGATLLAPLGALWALGARLRCRIRPDRPLPAEPPSLGVGNLRVGGTGKTPVVEDLGRRLAAEGHRVAVLTRGYRGADRADEPGWLAASGLEVFADADRGRSFRRAVAAGADRILLDDALQTHHRPGQRVALVLDRDLERPPRPLPAGPAREGREALRRADALLVRRERADDPDLGPGALGFRLLPEGLVDAAGREAGAPSGPGVLVSGLARPESFEADARGLGLELRASWRESDHWTPAPDAGGRLARFARDHGAQWVLVPEKNLARLGRVDCGVPVLALRSRIRWDGGGDPLVWLRARGLRL